MTSRIINDTDERIVIESGESLDGKILKDQDKTTVTKLIKYRIKEVKTEENKSPYRELRHCGRCGEFNDKDSEECESCGEDISDKKPVKLSR